MRIIMEITSLAWLMLVINLKSYLVLGQRETEKIRTKSFVKPANFKPKFDFEHTRVDHPANIDIGLSEWATKNQNQFRVGRGFGGVKHLSENENILSSNNRVMDARSRDKSRFPENRRNNFQNSFGQSRNSLSSVLHDLDHILNVKLPNLSKHGRQTSKRGFLNINANELLLSTLNILRDEINAAQSSAEVNENSHAGVLDTIGNVEKTGIQNENMKALSSAEVNNNLQPNENINHFENNIQDRNTNHLQSSSNIDNNYRENVSEKTKGNHINTENTTKVNKPERFPTEHVESMRIVDNNKQSHIGPSGSVIKNSTPNEHIQNIGSVDRIHNDQSKSNSALTAILDNSVQPKISTQTNTRSEQVGKNQQNRKPTNSNGKEPVNVDTGSVDMSFIPDQSAPGGRIPFIHNLEELLSKIPENGKPHVVITLDDNFGIASIEKTDNVPTTQVPTLTVTPTDIVSIEKTDNVPTTQVPTITVTPTDIVSIEKTGNIPTTQIPTVTVTPTPVTITTEPPYSQIQSENYSNDSRSSIAGTNPFNTGDVTGFPMNNDKKNNPVDSSFEQLSNTNIPADNILKKDKNESKSNIENMTEPQGTESGKTKLSVSIHIPSIGLLNTGQSTNNMTVSQRNVNEQLSPPVDKKRENVNKAVISDILDHVALLENEAETGKLTDEMLAEMGRVLALNAIKAIKDRAIRLKKRTDLNPVDIRGPNARFYPAHVNEVDINRISNPFDGVDLSDIVGLGNAFGNGDPSKPTPVNEIQNPELGRTNRQHKSQDPSRQIELQRQESIKRQPFHSGIVKNGRGTINSILEHSNEIAKERPNNNINFQTQPTAVDTNRKNDDSPVVFGKNINVPNETTKNSEWSLKSQNDFKIKNDEAPMVFGSDLKTKISGQSPNNFNRNSEEPVSGGNRAIQSKRLNPDVNAKNDINRIVFGSATPFQNPSFEKQIQDKNSNDQSPLFNDVEKNINKNNRMVFGSESHNAFNNEIEQPLPENAISKSEALEAILSSKAKAIDISKDESVSLSHILTDGLDLSSDSLNIGHPNDIGDLSPGLEDIIYDFSSESEFMKFLIRMNDGKPVQSDQIRLASDVANGFVTVPTGIESVISNEKNLQSTDIYNDTLPEHSKNQNSFQNSNNNAIDESQLLNDVDPPLMGIEKNTPSNKNIKQISATQNGIPNKDNELLNRKNDGSRNVDAISDSPSHVLFNQINQPQLPSIIGQNIPQRSSGLKPDNTLGQRNRDSNQVDPKNVIHKIQQSIGKPSIQHTISDIVGPDVNKVLSDITKSKRLDKRLDINTQRQNPQARLAVKNLPENKEVALKNHNQNNFAHNRPTSGINSSIKSRRTENKQHPKPTRIHKEGNLEIHTYPEFIIEFDHARGLTRRRRIRRPPSFRQPSPLSLTKTPPTQENQPGRQDTKLHHIQSNRQSTTGTSIPVKRLPSGREKDEPNKNRQSNGFSETQVKIDETNNRTPLRNLQPAGPIEHTRLGRLGQIRQFGSDSFERSRQSTSFRFGESIPKQRGPTTLENQPFPITDQIPGRPKPPFSNVAPQIPPESTRVRNVHLSIINPGSFKRDGLRSSVPDPRRLRNQENSILQNPIGSTLTDIQQTLSSDHRGFQLDNRNGMHVPSSSTKITSVENENQQRTTTLDPVTNAPIQTELSSTSVQPTLSNNIGTNNFPEADPFQFLLDPVDIFKDISPRDSVKSTDKNNRNLARTTETKQNGGLRNNNLPITTIGPSTTPINPTMTILYGQHLGSSAL
ncbi:hypothetical protein KUTeg_018339 [Tegillarca granosa]|uniref:Uncharacterized protein n=1 Tax=Tegillarca granosa TaxID=220873 RepID=A0ABQ9EK44_TEGGR|nr:hypothetical protein KUTeg_018339 [Tegillarca granosa]